MTEPNENVQSQLSAFVDSELPQDETELLVRRLSRDSGLQQSLNRYLLIGEALRSPKQALSRDLSMRVAAAIEKDSEPRPEVVTSTKPSKRKIGWAKTALGMSLAASVAAIAMMSFHSVQNSKSNGIDVEVASNGVAANQLSSMSSDSYVVPVATTSPSVPISAARLTNYVVAQSEFTSPLGRRNTMTGLVTGDQQTETVDETTDATGTGK